LPDGEPAAGASVSIVSGWPFGDTADAAGRCIIRNLAPDQPFLILAQDREHELCRTATVTPEQRGKPVAVKLALAAGAEFRLVDAEQAPLSGIHVTARIELPEQPGGSIAGPTDVGEAVSDAEGTVRFTGLPGGDTISYSIEQRVSKPVEWPKPVRLAAGEVQLLGDIAVDLTMADVSGVVSLPDQTPVRGAKVWTGAWHGAVARTDEAGRFTLRSLPAATPTAILANSPDGKLWGVEQLVPEWGYEPGIVLHPTVRVTARLVDAAGKPLARTNVILSSNVFIGDTVARYDVSTDEQGRLSVEKVIPGLTYDLLVPQPQPRDVWRSVHEVTPEGGAECALGDVVVPNEVGPLLGRPAPAPAAPPVRRTSRWDRRL